MLNASELEATGSNVEYVIQLSTPKTVLMSMFENKSFC